MGSKRTLLLAGLTLLAGVALFLGAMPLDAQQASQLGRQSLRPYGYVFVAYAIAWILVFGWVVAVARRLARLDRRLRD